MLSNFNTAFLITKHTNYQALPIKIQKHPISLFLKAEFTSF